MQNIMIVDDDIYIGDMLEETLRREGYGVKRAYSGTEVLMLLERETPGLVLLDLMLPGLSGEELLPHLAGIPVIVVSAKIDVSDKVKLLLGGAADYVSKPFDMKELLARITVQMRIAGRRNINEPDNKHLLEFDEISLDTDTHEVSAVGQYIRLTRTEFAILKLLMQNPTQVITKSLLLDRISLDTPDCMESSLKVHISNLRKKLRAASGKDYIEAVWGIGFKLKAE